MLRVIRCLSVSKGWRGTVGHRSGEGWGGGVFGWREGGRNGGGGI